MIGPRLVRKRRDHDRDHGHKKLPRPVSRPRALIYSLFLLYVFLLTTAHNGITFLENNKKNDNTS